MLTEAIALTVDKVATYLWIWDQCTLEVNLGNEDVLIPDLLGNLCLNKVDCLMDLGSVVVWPRRFEHQQLVASSQAIGVGPPEKFQALKFFS